jgi:hypothetical protein
VSEIKIYILFKNTRNPLPIKPFRKGKSLTGKGKTLTLGGKSLKIKEKRSTVKEKTLTKEG